MEILECIKTRRSHRKFSDQIVEDKKIEKIIEAGRYAPSGNNNQTCHFIVITNKEVLMKLKNLVQEEFSKMEIVDGMYQLIMLKKAIMYFIIMHRYLLSWLIKKVMEMLWLIVLVHLKI